MTNGRILIILERTLTNFNLATKLIINMIRIIVMIRYIFPMIRMGITNMKGDPSLTKGWNLLNIVFSSSCLNGKVDSNFLNLVDVFRQIILSYKFVTF